MKRSSLPSPAARALLALLLPALFGFVGLVLFGIIIYGGFQAAEGQMTPGQLGAFLAVAAAVSLFLGFRWYGAREMGFRGGRPLFASIGFAVLPWFVFLIARLVLVPFSSYPEGGAFVQFYYLLVFEAVCAHLWATGLFFRSVAEWRGPLTGAISAGLLFGLLGLLFFQEGILLLGEREANWLLQVNRLLYFGAWGLLYGIIRLRTGSWLGIALVQPFHSLTAWYILQPPSRIPPGALNNLYLAGLALYAIVIWRLWPKVEEDYRV